MSYEMRARPGKIVWRHKDSAMELYRPYNEAGNLMGFKRARCRQCGNADMDVSLTADGWCIECPECDGSASMLSRFRAKPNDLKLA